MRTKKRILILCVWDEMERGGAEGQSRLGSDTQWKERRVKDDGEEERR